VEIEGRKDSTPPGYLSGIEVPKSAGKKRSVLNAGNEAIHTAKAWAPNTQTCGKHRARRKLHLLDSLFIKNAKKMVDVVRIAIVDPGWNNFR
jgi:hypothetical protein